jgi:hypothetical protein
MKIVSGLRERRTLISAVVTAVVVLALVLSGPGFSANLMYPYGGTGYGYGYGYTAGEASDELGDTKNEYTTDETVYAVGSGFIPSSPVEVTITEDKHWTDGKSINSTIYKQKIVNADVNGSILDPIWPDPIPGGYDIIFNVNQSDNTYNPLDGDVVDDPNEPGFIVVGIVPALTQLGVIALIGLLSVIVAVSITIRKRR